MEVCGGPARPRLARQILLPVGGDEDRHRPGDARRDRARCLDAADAGHRDVHQHEIGPERVDERHRLLAGGRLAHELEVSGRAEDGAGGPAERRLIVCDEDADGHGASGIVPETRVPPPGSERDA